MNYINEIHSMMLNKESEEQLNVKKPPKRWQWFFGLYFASILAMFIVTGILEFIIYLLK